MKVKIKNIVNVIGRGQLVICELPDELLKDGADFQKIPNIENTVIIDSIEYKIKGYEKLSASKTVAFKFDKELNNKDLDIEFTSKNKLQTF